MHTVTSPANCVPVNTCGTQGIDVGDVDLVLHVRPCEGLVRQIDGTVEKRFAKKELLVPLQVGYRQSGLPSGRTAPLVKVKTRGHDHIGLSCCATAAIMRGSRLCENSRSFTAGGFFTEAWRPPDRNMPRSVARSKRAFRRPTAVCIYQPRTPLATPSR